MLTGIRLKNYRCYRDHRIAFQARSVIVGRNNAGKSTVVEALLLVASAINRRGRQFVPPPSWLELAKFRLGVSIPLSPLELNLRTIFHRYGEPPAEIEARFASGAVVTIYIGRESSAFCTVSDGSDWITSSARFKKLEAAEIHIQPQLGPLRLEERLLTRDSIEGAVDTRLSSLHFRNEMKLMPERFEDFKRLAEETWPDLRVHGLEEGSNEAGQRTLSLMLRDGDFAAEVGWMGHGLQMWLQTMWFLARLPRSSTVILDEPDVYMHPDLQRKLFRLVRDRYTQTIVATHSVEIMAEAEPSELLVIDRQKSRSEYVNSEPGVQFIIDHLGGVVNIHLARLWGSRKLIFVEGNELPILKYFQLLLFPGSESPIDTVPNMPLGGWGGWNYAVGSSMLLRSTFGDRTRVFCIFDRDYHSESEIKDRLEEAHRRGIQLHIWRKKEIENYLLNPRVLHRVIQRCAKKPPPPLNAVEDKLHEIADRLKQTVLAGYMDSFHLEDRKIQPSTAAQRAADWVDQRWGTIEEKLQLIPGKEALTRLSEWAGKEFNASFGSMTVLRGFTRNEVPAEIAKVLEAVEQNVELEP